ncbi:metallophosphoesterase [Methylobacterium sp. WL9]|uniref:metallophosphoesterase n=1 Tax=Methylobacterium sp. WL9 TaxID=2603898 RepID=UPI0011CC63E5|nr:metallophosphoesterase [Methylobacterium sp. WL9]TXN25054.1 metallophosphoesterase [Methylobacterium sp. WL9]
MRLWLFSDLHLDLSRTPWRPEAIPEADVAVVAGDIGQGLADTVSWLAATVRPAMPVVLVAGNHEFYGGAMDEERALGREAAKRQDIVLLDDASAVVAGCTFSGCTLWTDYWLDGGEARPDRMSAALHGLNDHRRITSTQRPAWRRFWPEDAFKLHEASRIFLQDALLRVDPPGGRNRPHVVVTHHAPSPRSIAAAYAGSALNAAFASDLDAFVQAARPDLWVHGHTHAAFDYRLGDTRVVCNPRGYDGERTGFAPGLVVDVG